jgi:predicted nucleic acid-binding protein
MMKIRAVLDTNVLIAAFRSRSSSSPNQEILDRWEKGHLDLLFPDDVLAEYVEKLVEHQVPREEIRDLIALLYQLP